MNLIKRGEAQLMEASNLGGGQLRIGASDTICRYYLVPFLNKFHKTCPNVHIKVTNQTSTKCVDLLEMGQVDLIVTNYPNSRLKPRRPYPDDPFVQRLLHRKLQTLQRTDGQKTPPERSPGIPDHDARPQKHHQRISAPPLPATPAGPRPGNRTGQYDLLIDLARIGLGIASSRTTAYPTMANSSPWTSRRNSRAEPSLSPTTRSCR